MKPSHKIRKWAARRRWAAILGVCAAAGIASGADTNAPVVLKPDQFFEGGDKSYDNWVDISAGGFFASGSRAEAQRDRQAPLGALGGIEDFHYQAQVAKNTILSFDGRAIFDDRNYRFKAALEKEKLGYLRFSFDEFRTWYNGNGGYYPPTGMFYPQGGDGLGLDRGAVSFEGGLRLEKKNIPDVTFKYTHDFRIGDKSSTIWGQTHPDIGVVQGLGPSFYDINEHSDSFQIDLAHTIKKTDFGAGIRYEFGKQNDALKINQFPGEPVEQKVTDRQQTKDDLFSAHAFTETWLKKNLMFSTGFSYSALDNSIGGSRIYGNEFDAAYAPSALAGAGYYAVAGGARLHDYVTDLNLFYKPSDHVTIVPSIRIQEENTDASVSGLETLGNNAAVPFAANSATSDLDVRERLDINYNGITNWVFYTRADLTEGNGSLSANGGLVPIGGIGTAAIQQETDDQRFFQKYSVGARWYPSRLMTVDAGGYFKDNDYHYGNNTDSTANNSFDRYPGYLVTQGFKTYDGNIRVTVRPWKTVTLSSRYEYQLSTIRTGPDPISGLPEMETSRMFSHIFAQDATWSPWTRLYLQAGANYVISKTHTPASDATQAILDAQNNYWTLNLTSGFVLDDKSDLKVSYFYYRANNYESISPVAVPYGAGEEQNGLTATVTRNIRKNIRASLKYGWFHGTDALSGGNNNYTAQLVYTTLQYRF